MDYRVFKSEDGRIFVTSLKEEFIASYKNGKWADNILFDAYELRDELRLVDDRDEANAIVAEAKKAFAKEEVA